METADVIVVGGGLAGLSTAWHLPAHLNVLILEQGHAPAQEASAQNASLIRRMDLEPAERALARRTYAWLSAPPSDWKRPPSKKTGAVLALGRDPLHLHDAVAHLRAGGVAVEPVEAPAELSPALHNSPLVRAWHLPDEHTADVPALVAGFLKGLQRMARPVRCNTRVTGLMRSSSGRLTGVTTASGEIHAGHVVLAGGAWCQRLAATAGLQRVLIPLRRHVAICRTDTPAHGPWVWVDDVGIYVRPHGREWLACPCDEAVDAPKDGPGSVGPLNAEAHQLLLAKLTQYFPGLGPPRIQSGWSGLRTFAPDRRPMLGADPELPGLWWAAGLGGAGLSGCIGVGEALATWMGGHTTEWLDPSSVNPGRAQLSRWPIHPDGDVQQARLIAAQG